MNRAFEHCKLILIKAGQSSAGSDVVTDEIDTRGFEGVLIFGSIATANAGNYVKVAQATEAGGSFADLEGSKKVVATNGDSFLVDIYRPLEPILKATVVRGGANTVTGDIYALLYGPRNIPVTHGSTMEGEQHISPAEGTA